MEQWLVLLISGCSVCPISAIVFIMIQRALLNRYFIKEACEFTYIDPTTGTNDRFQDDGDGTRIKVFNLPSDGSDSSLYDKKRQRLEMAKSFFLIMTIVSVHFIVLAGFLAGKRKLTTFSTLAFAFIIALLLVHFPLFPPPQTDMIKTDCFYEHVDETFIVVFFVFLGQAVLVSFLIYFVVWNVNDVYHFKTQLDANGVLHLIVAISVDYVRLKEFSDGFAPSALKSILSSSGKLILKKDDSEYHFFVQPTNLDIRIRAFMRHIGQLVIPIFIFIIAPVLLTFTESAVDVLLNILALTFIGTLDNSFGTVEYQITDKEAASMHTSARDNTSKT